MPWGQSPVVPQDSEQTGGHGTARSVPVVASHGDGLSFMLQPPATWLPGT